MLLLKLVIVTYVVFVSDAWLILWRRVHRVAGGARARGVELLTIVASSPLTLEFRVTSSIVASVSPVVPARNQGV